MAHFFNPFRPYDEHYEEGKIAWIRLRRSISLQRLQKEDPSKLRLALAAMAVA
jgi:hypothetical protein